MGSQSHSTGASAGATRRDACEAMRSNATHRGHHGVSRPQAKQKTSQIEQVASAVLTPTVKQYTKTVENKEEVLLGKNLQSVDRQH